MNRWLIGGVAGGAALLLAGGAVALTVSAQPNDPPAVTAITTPTPRVTHPPEPTPTATPEPAVEAVVVAPAVPVEVTPPEPVGPVLCPEGTWANSVDEFGNESNCQALNDEGQRCVGYDDANNCTMWYRD